MIKYSNFGIIS